LEVTALAIPEVKLIRPKRFGDHRGFFSETYNKRALESRGICLDFVQDNHSYSAAKGTVRGFHYQLPPKAQDKLVRVTRGAILDVALDIRRSSPTFGRWVSAVLSAAEWNQILVPAGFAHCFVTLEPDTEVIYKVTDYWSPEHERGILWCDPDLGIDWGIAPEEAVVSDKDKTWPRLSEQRDLFE
jgi:dTDP-4-dehydrorhamnose 3,5-epimerase